MPKQLIALTLCVTFFCACASFPKTPAYPKDDPSFVEARELDFPGLPNDQPVPLVLYPGDVLRIETVSTTTEVREGIVVDATGKIHVALAGDIDVAGLGISEAEAKIQRALLPFDKAVHVNLQLTSPAGQRVTVIGAVTTQGRIPLVPGARLADVIAAAGGPSMSTVAGEPVMVADIRSGVLMRNSKRVPISMSKALKGDPLHNVFIHPGDHIYIPPARGGTISVLGMTGSGGTVFPYRNGLRLTEALSLAGGITPAGDRADIRVIRGPLTEPRIYQTDLKQIVNGDSHDVALHPGDVIYVTDHPLEDFSEVMIAIGPIVSISLAAATLALAIQTAENRD